VTDLQSLQNDTALRISGLHIIKRKFRPIVISVLKSKKNFLETFIKNVTPAHDRLQSFV
jgi:hypothetical protein